jgi:pyruvate kinase
MMVEIVKNTENHLDYDILLQQAQKNRKRNISSAIGYSSVATAASLDAKCIITPTATGVTARVVSKFRPKAPIVGVSPNEETLRRMQIYRGVQPVKSIPYHTTDDVCEGALEIAKSKGFVEEGDVIVMTAGIPSPNIKKPQEGMSNMMRIAIVD